ncbi:hypothetical protein L2E82_29848 [Cichorium intybus]|uniref:Uncharacterized protein n=1 Tax=Cichorium intybus TaxID=13427 RepID=A0ACB9CYR5_CICIN|nr:hypothetical protein L2E82_29848 [Cichorium intybus]
MPTLINLEQQPTRVNNIDDLTSEDSEDEAIKEEGTENNQTCSDYRIRADIPLFHGRCGQPGHRSNECPLRKNVNLIETNDEEVFELDWPDTNLGELAGAEVAKEEGERKPSHTHKENEEGGATLDRDRYEAPAVLLLIGIAMKLRRFLLLLPPSTTVLDEMPKWDHVGMELRLSEQEDTCIWPRTQPKPNRCGSYRAKQEERLL